VLRLLAGEKETSKRHVEEKWALLESVHHDSKIPILMQTTAKTGLTGTVPFGWVLSMRMHRKLWEGILMSPQVLFRSFFANERGQLTISIFSFTMTKSRMMYKDRAHPSPPPNVERQKDVCRMTEHSLHHDFLLHHSNSASLMTLTVSQFEITAIPVIRIPVTVSLWRLKADLDTYTGTASFTRSVSNWSKRWLIAEDEN